MAGRPGLALVTSPGASRHRRADRRNLRVPETSRQGVVLEITDTGSGIPPALLPKVFELFFTTKAPGKGAGLGLAICEEIVNEHRGMIKVTSQIGVGTCVWVLLPAEEEKGDLLRPVKEEV